MTTTADIGQSSSEEELEKGLAAQDKGNDIFYASKKRLMWLRFKQHKVALFSAIMIIFFYLVAIFANFVSVQDINTFNAKYKYVPPSDIHWTDKDGNKKVAKVVTSAKILALRCAYSSLPRRNTTKMAAPSSGKKVIIDRRFSISVRLRP